MARTKYTFEKRQRDLAKKKKQEEKLQRKLEKKAGKTSGTGEGEVEGGAPIESNPAETETGGES